MKKTDAIWNENTFEALCESVEQALRAWSYATEHPIKRVMVMCKVPEYVPGTVWIFAGTKDELDQWDRLGHKDAITAQARSIINHTGLRLSSSELAFEFDSEESIEADHEGNHFRRIRPRHGR